MTLMPFREDPAGLFEAITKSYDAFNIPVIVTENGISTASEDQRDRYLSRALYAVKKAEEQLPNGVLKGYFLWSLIDNLEWDLGMKPQAFGAFSAKKTQQGLEFEDNPKRGGFIKK
jgi:beta-glucosidase